MEMQNYASSESSTNRKRLIGGIASILAIFVICCVGLLIRASFSSISEGSIGSFMEPSVKTYRSEVHGFGFDYPKDWALAEAPFMIHVGTSPRAVYTNLDTTHGKPGELVVNIARAKNGFIPNLNADNPNDAMDHLLRAGGQDTKEGFSEPVQKIINNKQTVYFTVERPQKENLLVLFTEVGEELFFMSAVSSFERAFEEDQMAILDIVASLELIEPNEAEGTSNTTFNSEIFNLRLDLPAGWIAAHEGDLLFNLARSLEGLQSVGKEPVNPSEVAAIFRLVPLAAPDFCGSLEPTAHSVLNDFVSDAQHFEELSEIYEVNANSKQVMAIKVRNTNLDVNMLLISVELDDAIALFITHVGANAPAEYESELYSIAASMEYSGSAVLSELSGIVEPDVPLDERFTSVLGGVSFDHPSDWEAKDTSSPTMLLNFSFGSVASLSSPGEFGSIVLTPTKLDTAFSEGADWGSALGIELGINLVSLLGTSERSTLTVNGTCLHVMDGTTFNGAGMYIVVGQLEDGRSVAFITATGPGQADTLEPYKETLLAIVSTVR